MKKLSLIAAITAWVYMAPAVAIDLKANPEVRQYIDSIAQQHDFDVNELYHWFSQIEFNERAVNNVKRLSKAQSWVEYRNAFVEPKRIQAGKLFWKTYAKMLKAAEKQYGVPSEIILGIIGVETFYGKNTGKSSVLEGLTTIAFTHPTRRQYFTNELTEFLLLSREQGWDPLEVIGSFDGGMGLAQFMPSSYRTYAISSGGHAYSDLFENPHDAIVSIGYYLEQKGWHRGEPVVVRAKVLPQHKMMTEKEADGKLNYSLEELAQFGFVPTRRIPKLKDAKVGLFGLATQDGMEYWITFHNFQVIRLYNTRAKYALTVYLLGNVVQGKTGNT